MRMEQMRVVVGLAVVAAMGVMLAGSPAQALLVRNDGTTLFDSRGFENPEVVGFKPSAAGPGTWSDLFVNTGDIGSTTFLVNDAASPGPGSGAQYMTVNKTGLPNNTAIAAEFSSIATTGTVTIDWKTYVDSSSTSGVQYYTMTETHVPGSATGFSSFFTLQGSGDFLSDTQNPPADEFQGIIPTDRWIDVNFEYTLGTTAFDITFDGGTTHNVAINSAMNAFAELVIRDGGGGGNVWVAHIDAIPEPASLSLLTLGGLMILRRRRDA